MANGKSPSPIFDVDRRNSMLRLLGTRSFVEPKADAHTDSKYNATVWLSLVSDSCRDAGHSKTCQWLSQATIGARVGHAATQHITASLWVKLSIGRVGAWRCSLKSARTLRLLCYPVFKRVEHLAELSRLSWVVLTLSHFQPAAAADTKVLPVGAGRMFCRHQLSDPTCNNETYMWVIMGWMGADYNRCVLIKSYKPKGLCLPKAKLAIPSVRTCCSGKNSQH